MRQAPRVLAALAAIVLLAGCGTGRQVSEFKSEAAAGDHAAIAAREVTCGAGERGCNQAHLIKGDACFRLAAGGDPSRYDCAVRHLGLGIDMSPGGTTEMGSTQPFYENLLEALRQRQDMARSSAEAAPLTEQLDSRAQGFRSAFPNAPAGYYYLASARLTRALDSADTQPAAACRMLNEAQGLLARAPADRGRYAPNFQRIEADISGAKSSVQGCV